MSTIHPSARIVATTSSSASGPGTSRSRRITRAGLAVTAPEPENREQERREEHLQPDDHERRSEHSEPLLGEVAEAAFCPAHDDHGDQREAGGEDAAAQQEAV